MEMNQFRGVKPTGNLGAVARREVEDLLGKELQGYADKAEVSQMIQAMDALPKGGVDGQILARVGYDSARWVAPPGTSVRSVIALDDRTMRVILSDGSVSDIPVRLESTWSKDAQAKVQGYWEVVSEEEPAQKTYTTRDGVTVPVKWTKPLSQIVPVFPEAPAWDDYEQKVLVPELVGLTYRLVGGQALPAGQWVKLPGQVPFDVTVEVVADAGYRLIAAPRWVHSFPNPQQVTAVTSDSFTRANGGFTDQWATDAALGGGSLPWSWVGDSRDNPAAQEALVKIQDNSLLFAPYTGANIPQRHQSTRIALTEGVPENWRVSFNLLQYSDVQHGRGLSLEVRGYGPENKAISLSLYRHASLARVDVTYWDSEQGKEVKTTALEGLPLGVYEFEKFRNTLRVKHSEGERSFSLPGHNPEVSNRLRLTLARWAPPGTTDDRQVVRIDDFMLEKVGF